MTSADMAYIIHDMYTVGICPVQMFENVHIFSFAVAEDTAPSSRVCGPNAHGVVSSLRLQKVPGIVQTPSEPSPRLVDWMNNLPLVMGRVSLMLISKF